MAERRPLRIAPPRESRDTRGRGTAENPRNRFETLWFVRDEESRDPDDPAPRTHFLVDSTRSIIAYNDSPDVGFDASVNPYRGCEHGCIYCYARPTHEYLGFSAGLDFETRILVKTDAPALLREELRSKRWKPQTLAMCGVTDPYQPAEKRFRLTRGCLEVLAEFRNPVVVITKNERVTRDIDLLGELARHDAALVCVSVTTLDGNLARVLEPRTSHPERRIEAIRALAGSGVPTCVLVAPIIPGLNDHEIPGILKAAAEAGAASAGRVLLRLPGAVEPLFDEWLERHFPDRRARVLNRVRETRGGKLNDPRFRSRMRGEGILAEQIGQVFRVAAAKVGLNLERPPLSTAAFRVPGPRQLTLFDEGP